MIPALDSRNSSGVRYVFSKSALKRNLAIALAVGSPLSLTNQWDIIFRGPFTARLATQIFFNLLIPFVVSSASALLNRDCP